MAKQILYIVLLILGFTTGNSATYYIAPNGNDGNAGTIIHPFQSLQKSQMVVFPGDTVFVRGGTYTMQESQITSFNRIFAYVIHFDKCGTEGKRIHYWAYPGEKPIFDFSLVKPPQYRVHAFEVAGSWLHIKGLEVIGVQVPIVNANTQSICFSNNGGSNNIYEQLGMHDGQAIGFYLTNGSNNLILNCDAYNNNDYTSTVAGGRNGGNVDGFGNHPTAGSINNIFRGCRAWLNSDDGYDCISAAESTIFENCWAFYNGYASGFVSRGDGNGFKVGGYGSKPLAALPAIIPRNTTRHCLAVMNKANGFYANHHLEGSDWFNNTAYNNGTNYNLLNRQAKSDTLYLKDGPGYNHVLKNNISLLPRNVANHLINYDSTRCTFENNTFLNNNFTVSTADFMSLDTAWLTAPRQPDGSLPVIDFMRLKPNSQLIDKGVNVGLPFKGKAPDIGCFETKVR